MHLLQWMHNDGRCGPACMRVHQVGLAQQGPGHGHEGESLGQRRLDGLELGDAAEQDERQSTARRGTGGRRGGRTPPRKGRTCRKRPPMNLKPSRTGPGRVAPNSRSGASPRKRYIGLASELPPVSSMASSTPSDSNSEATSRLSSSHRPPGTPSAMFSLAVTRHLVAHGVAHGPQDLPGEAGAVLHAAPEVVVAPVEFGAQEGTEEVVVADVDLDAVEAGLDGHRARRAGSPR